MNKSCLLVKKLMNMSLAEKAEDQANLAAGSDSVDVQQQAQHSNGDAVVGGAAGAAAFLAHSTRAALRDAARRDGAL